MNPPGLRLLRLVQRQVVVGQPLPFGVRDEHGKLLLARGQVVEHEAQLAALLERGAYVDAEEARAVFQAAQPAEAAARKLTLFDLWEQLIWRLDRVLKSVDEPGLPERVRELSDMLLALLQRDPDVGIYLAMRQDPKRLSIYGLTHALYSAMACALATARLGWSEGQTQRLVTPR
jgi:FMN phosphatase YigB (HAD superfamily)